jgi:uncharacterized membrane protein YkoI
VPKIRRMKFVSMVLAAVFAASLAVTPVGARADGSCLAQEEQRAAVRAGSAVKPRVIRQAVSGDLLNLQLCRASGGQLVYLATVLQRNGFVANLVLDARTGRLMKK